MQRYVSALHLILGLMVCSVPSVASTISPQTSETKFISNSSYPSDFLHIAPVNSAGISVNRFSAFTVNNKPLSIINPGSVGVIPSTIVVIANNISLQDTVEIVGDAADIVFLSESNSGSIQCVDCSLKNNFRVTMAVNSGSLGLSSNSTELGLLNTSSSGSVSIDGMRAPGALNVDILAGSINTEGTLNLHERANSDSNGGFVTAASGSLSIGTGALQFLSGGQRWDYDEQFIVGNSLSSSSSHFSGDLQALSVKINGSGPLDIDANINTKTDVVSSVRYRGNVKIAEESAKIYDFSNSDVSLNNLVIESGGHIALSAVNDLLIHTNARIDGRTIELIAGEMLEHYGETSGGEISIGSAYFLNEGWLSADRDIEAWADHWIINRSGGQIIANTIDLQANGDSESFILNGSRTPYEQTPAGQLTISDNYFDQIDPTKIGTYYAAGLHEVGSFSGLNKPIHTSAHILARKISVKTQAFENINPYFEFVDEFGADLVVDRTLINQVSVIAEDTLDIEAAKYILNSSALMGSEGANSKVHLTANTVANERYRVLAMLDIDYYSQEGEFVDTGRWQNGEPVFYYDTNTTETIQTKMATFSPPGVLYSLGSFEFSSGGSASNPTGLFLNSIGYFEVFGEAKFNAASVIDAGIENQGITRSETIRDYIASIGDSVSSSDHIVKPEEMDSLFYVGGVARAAQVDSSRFVNYSPFKGYLQMMLSELMSDYAFVGTGSTISAPTGVGYIEEVNFSFDLYSSLNLDGDITDIHDDFTITWYEEKMYFVPGTSAGDDTVRSESTDTYSIFDEIKNLFEDLVDSFIEIFNELKWW